ncbi:hypothetical protein LEP1GSC124_1388 [Leptospira interrogans serovar Pyrogenes str. 200701872]|uniref:Uncharacterized protein n=1 Tax=Leptospira interrogans serovar Pyrogenes str. 200701872 TaxID=1193029 RepID=M6ZS62_LEPIR|nr:hypothetical protein LEP1GSC124_1388 [Leptospira interrogans serovar Pyrogenes str. 200701872]
MFDDLHRIKNPFYKIHFKIKLLSEMPLYVFSFNKKFILF